MTDIDSRHSPSPDDAGLLDQDLTLITAYLIGEMPLADIMAIEDRLDTDTAFRHKAQPLLDVWFHPDSFQAGELPAASRVTPLLPSTVENGWHRFLAEQRAHHGTSTVRLGTDRVLKRGPEARSAAFGGRSIGHVAAIALLVLGSLVGLAQGVTYVVRTVSAPKNSAPQSDETSPTRPGSSVPAFRGHPEIGDDLAVALSTVRRRSDASTPQGGSAVSAQPPRWVVDSIPVIDIGIAPPGVARPSGGAGALGVAAPARRPNASDPGMPPEVLSGVVNVVRLTDGRIVIAEFDRGLKFFSAAGKPLATVDLSAFGMNAIHAMWRYRGDSLLLIPSDGGAQTSPMDMGSSSHPIDAVIVEAQGRIGRRVHIQNIDPATANPARDPMIVVSASTAQTGIQGVLDDGSFVLRGWTVTEYLGSAGTRLGRCAYFRVRPDGSFGDTIFTRPIQSFQELGPPQNGRPDRVQANFSLNAPRAAVHGRTIYWNDGARFDVTAFDLSGWVPVVRLMPSARPAIATTDSLRDYYVGRVVASIARGVRLTPATRDGWLAKGVAPTVPAVNAIQVDASGDVWLEHYRVTQPVPNVTQPFPKWIPDPTDVPRYTVLDPSGRELAEVAMPNGFTLAAIGPDWVLGVVEDAQAITHVQVLRLRR